MIIDVYPSICSVNGTYKESGWVYETLSFKIPGSEHSNLFKKHLWDGKKHFFMKGKFPVGLLSYVLQKKDGPSITVQDHRKFIEVDDLIPELIAVDPRDYQREAILKFFEHKNCIIEVATNGGKTLILSGIIKKLYPNPILVLIHRKEIFDQLTKFIKQYTGIGCGAITANGTLLKPVTIAMASTLKNRLGCDQEIDNFFESVQCVAIDEAHHCKSPTYHDILFQCPAPYRVGFSGTIPDRKSYEGVLTRAYLGDVVYTVSNEQLIQSGVSARPKIYLYEVDVARVRGLRAEAEVELDAEVDIYDGKQLTQRVYRKVIQKGIVENEERNGKVVEIINENIGKSVLIVVDYLEHGEIVKKLLVDNGILAEFISGSAECRTKALSDFKDGHLRVLISSNILDEGIDISGITILILLAGKKSKRQLLQRVGRSLRKKEGENTVKIVDFMEWGNKYLEKHAKERYRIYKEEGFEISFV